MIWYKVRKVPSFGSPDIERILEKGIVMAFDDATIYNFHFKEGYAMVEMRVLANGESFQIDTASNTVIAICTSGAFSYVGGIAGQSGRCDYGESSTFPSNSGAYVLTALADNTIVVLARFFTI
ncbi:hypothetical protein [Hydrogenobacter thermophilus]|uniref:hypothetical protein n=1 Tax=Hydrogenobacter thermophilus TaxID=940 RepID=UPI0030F4C0B2